MPLARELSQARQRRSVALLVAFGVLALANALFVVRVGGDIYPARLLLTPLFGFLAPVMMAPWRKAYATFALVGVWSVATLVALRTPLDAPVYLNTGRNPVTLRDYRYVTYGLGWYHGSGVYYFPKQLAGTPLPGRDGAVAAYGVGALSYELGPDVYVLDLLGLGDAFTSHLHLGAQRGPLVAHEKPLPAPWIAARLLAPPDTETYAQFPIPQPYIPLAAQHLDPNPPAVALATRVAQARAALQCGSIHDLLDATSGSLSFGKFMSNLAHAPSYTTLRIPADPLAAERRFCKR